MRRYYKSHLRNISRKLRSNMTEAEIKLWNRIRKKQINNFQFYRQKPLGKYVADFYCPVKELVIEIDGGQRYDEAGEITREDKEKENYLKNILKLKVIRFTNIEITKNLDGVVNSLIEELK
ncbi:MAG: endonuclease domain-containing protein [bacterium]